MPSPSPSVRQGSPELSCTLTLKLIPNAPRNEIAGWLGEALKIKIHAPAVEGRANDALLEFLATEFNLPRRNITLVRGEKSRHKVVRMEGVSLSTIKIRLAEREHRKS